MQPAPVTKYAPLPPIDLPNRQWPDRTLTRAPIWCSVDLRDGNQALAQPMSVEEKLEFFDMLVRIGFKEIEVGFPSASQIEFDFTRRLIEESRIPDDVAIQVLCQCRDDLITRSLESVQGAKNVIFHLYNSTSPNQREYVFNLPKSEIVQIAGARRRPAEARERPPLWPPGTRLRLEYSPESFTSTELEFALEICEAVSDVWGPTPQDKIILNLPATVEYATPNVHADQIEWMCTHLTRREQLDHLPPHPQRPRDRGRGHRARPPGRGRPRRGNALRQRRKDRQPGHRHRGPEPLHPRNPPGPRLERPERDPGRLRALHPPRGAAAPALRGRTCLHRVQRIAPGRHQEIHAPPEGRASPGTSSTSRSTPPTSAAATARSSGSTRSRARAASPTSSSRSSASSCRSSCTRRSAGSSTTSPTRRAPSSPPRTSARPSSREYLGPKVARRARAFQDDRARTRPSNARPGSRSTGSSTRSTGAGNGPIDAFVRALAATSLPKFDVLSYSEHSLGAGSRGEGRQLHPDQDGARVHVLRRRHRHEHRAGFDQGDCQRAQPGRSPAR